MNKRTFDVIAKYISAECGIKVVISPDVQGPQMNIDKKTIWLPEAIKEENALSALAALIHEAGHMKWTIEIPNDITSNDTEFHVLNAMEDVRIDLKNFNVLPNIREFYKRMYKEHSFRKDRKANLLKAPLMTRVLITNILYYEGFGNFNVDPEAMQISNDLGVTSLFGYGYQAIDYQNWDEVKRIIKEIISKFTQDQQGGQNGNSGQQGQSIGVVTGGGEGRGDGSPQRCGSRINASPQGAGHGRGEDDSGGDEGSSGQDKDDEGADSSDQQPTCESCDDYLRAGSIWGKGSGLTGPGGLEFNPIELQESTRRKFIDALSIKEKRVVNDGKQLDADNLIAFFTGEIEELFKDEVIEKKRRSKIIFALDCSGSMGDRLPLGKDYDGRRKVLVNTVKSLTELLDEIIQVEGLAVEYEVCAFDDCFHRLSKENWVAEYYQHGGGTWIFGAYDSAKKILLENPEIDGNKMLVLVTDGEVGPDEIDQVRNDIVMDNNDIRVMIVGIGADIGGRFVETIIGDNNIICEEHAEQVLMEAIQTMLD